MHIHPLWPGALGGFGVAAAILIVGGSFFIRWQRNRQRFELAKLAIEKGLSTIPGVPPIWLASLRSGVMVLVLGIALLCIGAVGTAQTQNLQSPPAPVATMPAEPPVMEQGPEGMHPRPPHPDPAREAYDRAMAIHHASTAGVLLGIILSLLGAVRIVFAFAERRYTIDPANPRV